MVERRTEDPRAAGSTPAPAANNLSMPEWRNWHTQASKLLTNEFASFLLHRKQRLILPASYTPSRAGVPAFSPHF